jgi:hypothetical protein
MVVLRDVAGGLPSVTSVIPNSSVLCQRQASFIQLNFSTFICIIDVNLRIILHYLRSSKLSCLEFPAVLW